MKKHLLPALLLSALLAACATNGTVQGTSCSAKTDKLASTPLLYSARSGDAANVRCLLNAGVNVNEADKGGSTALMFAALKGHTDIVRLLLDKGANVNAATTHGVTALMAAATQSRADTVRLLLEKGANPNATDSNGNTAISLAENRGFTATKEGLTAHAAGHSAIVKMLRAAGAKE